MTKVTMPAASTKKFKVLQFIGSKGEARFNEIQRFICEMNGRDYDEFIKAPVYKGGKIVKYLSKRRNRGYWVTTLCQGPKAILTVYCQKNHLDNTWRLKPAVAKALAAV